MFAFSHRPLAALIAAVLASSTAAVRAESERLVDGIAAQVGGEIVLISEVESMAAPVEARMREMAVPSSEIRAMRADVLDRLIEARLLSSAVKRLELQASEREVDAAIDGIASDTGLSRAQLEQSVKSHGLSLEEYRAKIRAEIERTKVLNTMVRSRVRVEPAEVEALYWERFGDQPSGGEEVHLRHVLVAFGPDLQRDAGTACGIAQRVSDEVKAGAGSFIEVAQRLDGELGVRGGDLGWIHLEEAASWMTGAVRGLEPGQVSDAVETPMGCHVLELVERRRFERKSLDDARAELESEIFREKMEEEYRKWVDTLRAQTYVERKDAFRSGSGS